MDERHDRIEELLAVRALGGLEPGELAEYDRIRAEHGRDCEVCRRAELEFDEVAGRLAFVLAPVAVPAGMEDALVARAARERPAAVAEGAASVVDDLERRREARRPGLVVRTLTAVAAAIVLVAGAFAGGFLARGGGSGGTSQQLAAYLAHPDVHLVSFRATSGGNLAVAFRPGQDRAFVFGSGLRSTPSGKQYELWLFPPGGGAPARGPSFDAPSGDDAVVIPVSADPSRSVLMAVTVEKAGGVGAPTTTPVFTAPITSV
jgi:Anti-sigma-K factor rskA